jgi:hypothetical protein
MERGSSIESGSKYRGRSKYGARTSRPPMSMGSGRSVRVSSNKIQSETGRTLHALRIAALACALVQ